MPTVKMLLSEQLLASILKLEDVGRIVAASVSPHSFGAPTWVELEVETEYGPEGAMAIEPLYERTQGIRDPFRRYGIRWQRADGTWEDRIGDDGGLS